MRTWLLFGAMVLATAVIGGISFAENEEPLSQLMESSSDSASDVTTRGMGGPYEGIVDKIRKELSLPFTNPNDPGLYERRERLKKLFKNVPPAYANLLYEHLGEKSSCGDLSRQFHYRLATPTRQELVGILKSIPRSGPISSEEDRKAVAKESYGEGETKFVSGQYGDAAECFKKSYNIYPDPRYVFNIGLSYERKGKQQGNVVVYQQAVSYYKQYLASNLPADRRAKGEERISQAEAEIAQLKSRSR